MTENIDYIFVEYTALKVREIYDIFLSKLHDRSLKMLLSIDMNTFHIIEIIIEFGFDGVIVSDTGDTGDLKNNKTRNAKCVKSLKEIFAKYPEPYNTHEWCIYIKMKDSYNNLNYQGKPQEMCNIVDYPGSKFVKSCFEQFIIEIIESYM
jgi:hypothetical protein